MDYVIHHIEIDQFAAIEDPNKEDVTFSISILPGCNIRLRSIVISIGVSFSVDENTPFLIMKANTFFEIKEDSWNSMKDNSTGNYIVPNKLLVSFIEIAINHVRGMLFVKTENTPFSKYVVPLVPLSELKPVKDLVIKPDGTIQDDSVAKSVSE